MSTRGDTRDPSQRLIGHGPGGHPAGAGPGRTDRECLRAHLTTKVRELRPRSRAGRKPRPKIAIGIERVVKGLEVAYEQELSSDDLGRIGREEAATLADQVEQSLERLAELKRVLAGVLGGPADAS